MRRSLTLTRQRALSIANLSIYHLALKLDTYLHGIHLFIFTSIWKTTCLQVVRFHNISNFVKSDFCSIHEQAVNMTSSFLGSLFPNNSCLSIFILVPVELNISPATPGTEHHLDCFALAGCFCFLGAYSSLITAANSRLFLFFFLRDCNYGHCYICCFFVCWFPAARL